jgi:hypothetical protein
MFVFPHRLVVGDVPVIHLAAASIAVGAARTQRIQAVIPHLCRYHQGPELGGAVPQARGMRGIAVRQGSAGQRARVGPRPRSCKSETLDLDTAPFSQKQLEEQPAFWCAAPLRTPQRIRQERYALAHKPQAASVLT